MILWWMILMMVTAVGYIVGRKAGRIEGRLDLSKTFGAASRKHLKMLEEKIKQEELEAAIDSPPMEGADPSDANRSRYKAAQMAKTFEPFIGPSHKRKAERDAAISALGPRPAWWRMIARRVFDARIIALNAMDISMHAEILAEYYPKSTIDELANRRNPMLAMLKKDAS